MDACAMWDVKLVLFLCSEVKASLDLSLSRTQINLVVNTVISCSHGPLSSRPFVTGGYGSSTLGGFHNRYYLYSCEGLFCRVTNTCPSHLPCYYMCAGILLRKEFLDWIPHNWCGHSSAALFGIQVLDSKTALSHGCWLDGEKLFMPSIQKFDSPVDITWHSRGLIMSMNQNKVVSVYRYIIEKILFSLQPFVSLESLRLFSLFARMLGSFALWNNEALCSISLCRWLSMDNMQTRSMQSVTL